MRLAAIFCVWDDWDMLERSYKNIYPLVDDVIVIGSEASNYGEFSKMPDFWRVDMEAIKYEPRGLTTMQKETAKRNEGLRIALERGYTHFIMMDADEFYHYEKFKTAKERFHVEPELQGLVIPCNCYFKSPTLTIGRDITLVPFIHKLTERVRHEFNTNYPFAWINGQIRIDPTRSINIDSGVEYTEEVVMEHYSWVRKDYAKKIRNSTAKANLERSTITQDLMCAKEGYYCNFYGKVLHTVPNYFNIPDYGVAENL